MALLLEDLRPGQRVVLVDSEHYSFSGVVHKVYLDRRILKLRNCVDPVTNKIDTGLQTFPEKEIVSLNSLVKPFHTLLSLENGDTELKGDLKGCQTTRKPEQSPQIFDSERFEGKNFPEFSCVRKQCWEDRNTPPNLQSVPRTLLICDRLDGSDFNSALDQIMEEDEIGLSFEGRVKRSGELSLISVATRNCVFLFDVVTLGPRCLEGNSRLRRLLEATTPTKVMHNASAASDLLYHEHGIKLSEMSCYDTLAAHLIFMSWSVHDQFRPSYALSYVELVRCYLGVREKFLPFQVEAQHWMKRPLASDLFECAMKNVMYLLDLKLLTARCRDSPLMALTNVMLGVVKEVSIIIILFSYLNILSTH